MPLLQTQVPYLWQLLRQAQLSITYSLEILTAAESRQSDQK